MSMMSSLKATEVTPRTVLLSLAVFLLLTGGVIAGVMKLVNGSSTVTPVEKPRAPHNAVKPAAKPDARETFVPAGDYTIIIKRDLFHSGPIIPPKGDVPPVAPSPFASVGPVTPPPPPAPPAPKIAYTGHVEIGSDTFALLESLDTQIAQYARVGDMAFGCKLTAIDTNYVKLEVSGQTITLNIGENKVCLLYTSPSPRDGLLSRMPSSA